MVAHTWDDTGVDSILLAGVSFRGDVDLGTDTTVLRYSSKMVRFTGAPMDTTISRYLAATPDTTRESSVLYAIAYDSNGNISADSVSLTIGGPRVEFLTLEENQQVQAGLGLNLQVEAADPEGVLDLVITIEGVFDEEIEFPFNPPPQEVVVDTSVVIPAGLKGQIRVTATARNGLAVSGQDGPITLEIVDSEIGDETPPALTVATLSTPRLELDDQLKVVVTGADNTQGSGIARVGYTVKSISARRGVEVVQSGEQAFNPARTGNVSVEFGFMPFNVDELGLPDTLTFEITGWAIDADGNCAAAVDDADPVSYPCTTLAGGQIGAEGRAGIPLDRVIASGQTVDLPGGGIIMDAAVDTLRRKLFLSNLEQGQVEVFDLETGTFRDAIGVGSLPWGLAIDGSGDRMIVANSGGANFSIVDLEMEAEVDQQRFFAPDAVIFDLELKDGDSGLQFILYPFPQPESPSFSDRPQFVALDSLGNYIYSTRTNDIGDIGTARKAYFPEGAERPETKVFVEHGLNERSEDFWAFAHLDSIGLGSEEVLPGIFYAGLTLFDHVPGFPDSLISATANISETNPVGAARNRLAAKGSDVYMDPGARWNIPNFGFADTTFVAASGDGGWVLIGEGGNDKYDGVILYRASQRDTTDLSSTLRYWDNIINPADRVNGIGLNYDGTLGVARGETAYFFDTELQLSGIVELPGAGAGTGAAFHPLHANQITGENPEQDGGEYRPDTHLAFVGTGDGTVDIIDTFRFRRIGQVTLRDVITGPLRAILPFPEDNAGLSCPTVPVADKVGNSIGNAIQLYNGGQFTSPIPPDGITDEACIVMKLFGITSAGGVVVVPVRKSEILKYHPNR
jgi:hypothetical protein